MAFGLVMLAVATACHKNNSSSSSSKSDSTKSVTNDTTKTVVSEHVSVDGRGIYYVTNLPADTGAAKAYAPNPVYFSMTTNGLVDSSNKLTTNWDIAFTNLYNSYVTVNNGSISYSPGYGDASAAGSIWVVNRSFDSVTTVPSEAADSLGSVGYQGYPNANWTGWYNYNMSTHIITPIASTTLVIKLVSGKYAKLDMISIYKNNPASPTLSDTLQYLTFKYYVQKDGSTNLATRVN